jgi:hypothetical protein
MLHVRWFYFIYFGCISDPAAVLEHFMIFGFVSNLYVLPEHDLVRLRRTSMHTCWIGSGRVSILHQPKKLQFTRDLLPKHVNSFVFKLFFNFLSNFVHFLSTKNLIPLLFSPGTGFSVSGCSFTWGLVVVRVEWLW